jgi:hypothetical protein
LLAQLFPMIAGFDELILQCTNESARANIREAVRCYESGSYRAAIVTTYVALTFDLIEKLRLLAAGGDGEAKQAAQELDHLQEQLNQGNDQAVTGLLKFERNLLELFRDKFEFFGAHEFEDLARLREDRNRCAHPTFSVSATPYAPSAELARLHIRNALVLVLTQPPRQGKAALESIRTVVLSPFFPTTLAEAADRLRHTELGSARAALVNAFVDDIAFGWPTPGHALHHQNNAIYALEAAVEVNRPACVPRIITDANKLLLGPDADGIRFGAAMALRIPEAGEALSNPAKTVLKEVIKSPDTLNRGDAIVRGFEIEWLKETAAEAAGTLSIDEIAAIQMADIPDEIVQRVVGLYSEAGNWNQANSIADKGAIPFASRLSQPQIEQVLNSAKTGASDLQGSNGFVRFLTAVATDNPIGKAKLNELLEQYDLEHYAVGD